MPDILAGLHRVRANMIFMFSLVRLGCRNLEDIAVQEIDMKLASC